MERRGEAREMEIVETFSRRQEGRRVKHKFREKKSRSDSKLWNGLTPLPPSLTTVKYRPAVSSTGFFQRASCGVIDLKANRIKVEVRFVESSFVTH